MRIGACAASTLLWRCAPAACWAPNLNVCPVRSGSVRCLCRRSPRRERLRVGTTTQYTVRCCRCRCRCLQSAAHGSDTALTQARKSARVCLLLTDNAVSRHTALICRTHIHALPISAENAGQTIVQQAVPTGNAVKVAQCRPASSTPHC